MLPTSFHQLIHDDEDKPIKFKKRGVGRGHSIKGSRERWTKHPHFDLDLFQIHKEQMSEKLFKSCYVYAPAQIDELYQDIRLELIRPRETMAHSRNKLLLFMDKLHNSLSGNQMSVKYHIGVETAFSHIRDVVEAILNTFKDKNMVTFPSVEERALMVKILAQRQDPLPHALFAVDGSHIRCVGRKNHPERHSKKYGFWPAFNLCFMVERCMGTIVAFNMYVVYQPLSRMTLSTLCVRDPSCRKHDIKVLREAWFFPQLDEIMKGPGGIILADKGYIGIQRDTADHTGVNCIAASYKMNRKGRKNCSNQFWFNMAAARGVVETTFAKFFFNKFPQLCRWPGKAEKTFNEWAANVTCCIIIYNKFKRAQRAF